MASAKRGLYHLHIELEDEYQPIRKRNKISVVSPAAIQTMRLEERKHLDLWTDGRLYPIDPIKKSTPPFYNCSSLMRFIGDGYGGLLGYTYNLVADRDLLRLENQMLKQENQMLNQQLEESKEKIKNLQKQLNVARRKQTKLGIRERERRLKNIENLKRGGGGCSKRISAVR